MGFTGASSIVIALAVGLWLCYAVPIWLRRHNELAVERHAVQLQQTLRALAETAEMPRELRVEASARSVAAQRRALKSAERRAEEARLERLRAEALAGSSAADLAAKAALRRGRLLTSCVLVAGLATAGVGVWLGLSAAVWWPLALGALVVLAAFGMLAQLDRVSRARRARAAEELRAVASDAAAPSARTAPAIPADVLEAAIAEAAAEGPAVPSIADAVPTAAGWTPSPLPRPLYLARELAADDGPEGPDDGGRPAERDHMAELVAAVRRSEQRIREAHQQAGVATFGAVDAITLPTADRLLRPVASAPEPAAATAPQPVADATGAASPWAEMGRIGELGSDYDDITEILRRRRAS